MPDWIAQSFGEMLEDERQFYRQHRERKIERFVEARSLARQRKLEDDYQFTKRLASAALAESVDTPYDLTRSISKGYKPLRSQSSIAERALKNVARTVEAEPQRLLSHMRDPSLSLGALSLPRRDPAVQEFLQKARQQLSDADVRVRQLKTAALRNLPLISTKTRQGFHRSSNDRNTAILGILDLERRRSARLSAKSWARAKAIAASRSASQSSYVALSGESRPSVDYDPCIEYYTRQNKRRQVMFAKSLAGRGYRSRHHMSPC